MTTCRHSWHQLKGHLHSLKQANSSKFMTVMFLDLNKLHNNQEITIFNLHATIIPTRLHYNQEITILKKKWTQAHRGPTAIMINIGTVMKY